MNEKSNDIKICIYENVSNQHQTVLVKNGDLSAFEEEIKNAMLPILKEVRKLAIKYNETEKFSIEISPLLNTDKREYFTLDFSPSEDSNLSYDELASKNFRKLCLFVFNMKKSGEL